MMKRNENLKLEKEKEDTWQLYEECKEFLEKNERNREIRRKEREIEKKKLERLKLANKKKDKTWSSVSNSAQV